MITLEEAKALKVGQTLYHTVYRNADGTPQRWRVNGKVKTWKRDPFLVKVPIKYGLRWYDCLTEKDLDLVSLVPLTKIDTID
jgi:hypothetical protein